MPKFEKGHRYFPRSKEGICAMREKMSGEKNPAKRPDIRAKISENRRGISTNKGRKLSEETKNKISKAHKGRKKPWAGKSITEEGRRRIRIGKIGEKNNNWRGGITPIHEAIRHSARYKKWRSAVFKRDSWKCVWCGFHGYVEADHIKPFAQFPKFRFVVSNGRTLCRKCHDTTKHGRPKLQRNSTPGASQSN